MGKTTHAKLVIIGSGPAGYTAAIYAARAMLEPVLIQGIQPGGQLTITTDVENYPGFADVIQGPWLMEQMRLQATHVGTNIVADHVTKVDLSRRPFRLDFDSGDVYLAETLVLATGAQARWLDLPSEHHFKGYGVSACATRDSFRAEKILQERLFKDPKIAVLWDTVLEDVVGVDNPLKVTGARLRNLKTGTVTELPIDGIFIAIGHVPATELVAGQVKMKPSGYIVTAPHS